MAKKDGELTPLMKQYWDVKSLHPDKILMFRMGDFFEMFYDDAVLAAPLLGITLTQRNKKSEDQTPMCGMPHHSIAQSINKLLAAGLKVAICDQIEDAKFAKGLVKRAITRILTPGMVYDSDVLDATNSHYIAALHQQELSFIETTTGECFYYQNLTQKQIEHLLQTLPIAEVVYFDDQLISEHSLQGKVKTPLKTQFCDQVQKELKNELEHFAKSKFEILNLQSQASFLLFHYVVFISQGKILETLQPFEKRHFQQKLHISSQTLRHLEVFQTYKGQDQGSLFFAINRTKTSAGARKLRHWLMFPLIDQAQLNERYEIIDHLRSDLFKIKKIRELLNGLGDLERRLSKVSQSSAPARDVQALALSIQRGLEVYRQYPQLFSFQKNKTINLTEQNIDALSELSSKILKTIVEDPPLSVKQGGVIKRGVHTQLDEYIELSTNAQGLIEALEKREREQTGISSLKVRYNNVFGYFIEITHLHKDKVPTSYQRKQTLANAERFCTDELIELERKVLTAQTKRNDLEFEIFEELRAHILKKASEILYLSHYCSELDVFTSLAWLSLEENYVRPELNSEFNLYLEQSRHPVVEQFMRGQFIPNTITLKPQEGFLMTGPNMAGKSTLMRQVALSVLLAQVGSFVPASKAQIPLYESLFTRIGASDQLSEGLSTFMVEMTETAQMLNEANEKSLLILDEVGRGTSTYDGMCLAQSIIEHILQNLKSHVLFATHYHELTSLELHFPQLKNVHMKIFEKSGQIEFLHILSSGPAGRSYGVQVAEKAGLPLSITERAKELLKTHETKEDLSVVTNAEPQMKNLTYDTQRLKSSDKSVQKTSTEVQLDLFKNSQDLMITKIIEEIKTYNLNAKTPLDVMIQLSEWQSQTQKIELNH